MPIMNRMGLAVACAWVCLNALASGPVQVLCPYSIAGRVVTYDNVAFDASSGVTLTVRGTNGTVLAKSKVFTPGLESAWNYRLDIPVATRSGGGYAQPGDVLAMTATDGKGVVYAGLVRGESARIGQAGATATVRVMLAEDANGNGVADAYETSKQYDMWLNDIEGDFDPSKDYDGDGVSNFDEYLAGTDPFDRNDCFRVRSASVGSASDVEVLALTFEANAGRSYVVNEAADLGATAKWARGVFRLDPAAETTVERVSNGVDTWSMRTIYLIKSGSRRFYKLEMEQ